MSREEINLISDFLIDNDPRRRKTYKELCKYRKEEEDSYKFNPIKDTDILEKTIPLNISQNIDKLKETREYDEANIEYDADDEKYIIEFENSDINVIKDGQLDTDPPIYEFNTTYSEKSIPFKGFDILDTDILNLP